MKKNFLMVGALMVTAFFAATEIAKAADVTFSGQIRTRYESNEQGANNANTFNSDSDAADFMSNRVRLNANVNVNDSTSAFIQMQSVHTFGGLAGSAFPVDASSALSNNSFDVSDNDTSVGLHQAYFTLKNFATLPVDLKVGRQEVVLDGHRLFGNTGWTQGAQTHDAVRLTHAHDNMSFNYAWVIATEDGVPGNNATIDANDEVEVHLAHFNMKGILGGNLSAIYAWVQDPCGLASGATCNPGTTLTESDIHTIGFRQAGQLYGIDYRGEYYYQWGDADTIGDTIAGGVATGTSVDRDAYMFGVRVGKAFNNVTMKPSLTLWYDYLSGTSDADLAGADPEYKSFNTLFDTGHKFYGLMDMFLGVGGGGAGNGTLGLGFQDIAIKAKLSPMPDWTLKVDYHWFMTAESSSANSGRFGETIATAATTGQTENDLGNELDITLINKYNANTNISLGFSNYTTTALFRDLRSVRGDGANWAYVMFDVKF